MIQYRRELHQKYHELVNQDKEKAFRTIINSIKRGYSEAIGFLNFYKFSMPSIIGLKEGVTLKLEVDCHEKREEIEDALIRFIQRREEIDKARAIVALKEIGREKSANLLRRLLTTSKEEYGAKMRQAYDFYDYHWGGTPYEQFKQSLIKILEEINLNIRIDEIDCLETAAISVWEKIKNSRRK